MKRMMMIATVLLAVAVAPEATATEEAQVNAPESQATPLAPDSGASIWKASFTLSTLNLAKPILSSETLSFGPELELLAEFKVTDVLGVAGLVGYGGATAHNLSEPYNLHAYRAGVQAAWYPFANFDRGFQLGTQGLFRHITTGADIDGIEVSGQATAFDLTAFIGYKAILGPGFTLLTQIGGGAQFSFAQSEASDGTHQEEVQDRSVAPAILFNLNLGWSI